MKIVSHLCVVKEESLLETHKMQAAFVAPVLRVPVLSHLPLALYWQDSKASIEKQ